MFGGGGCVCNLQIMTPNVNFDGTIAIFFSEVANSCTDNNIAHSCNNVCVCALQTFNDFSCIDPEHYRSLTQILAKAYKVW